MISRNASPEGIAAIMANTNTTIFFKEPTDTAVGVSYESLALTEAEFDQVRVP